MPEIRRFRHRPTVVEAVRWTGDNEAEVQALAGDLFTPSHPVQLVDGVLSGAVYDRLHESWIGVKTGQWVIKGTKGEFHPIDDEVLRETYDHVGTPDDNLPPGLPAGTFTGTEEWAVFWGGEDPYDCAGSEVVSCEAEALEDRQWRVTGGVARRSVLYGRWTVTVPPEHPDPKASET